MERILALQNMSDLKVEDQFLNSTQSNHCSSNSNNRMGCSSESNQCTGTAADTLMAW